MKLGYGGTQEEMKRLIADAAKLSDTVDAQDMSFANIVKAINVVQTEMGITGTTALEAGRTISGSIGAMKSAWTNLITGLTDGNADIGKLVDNLVTTIVGDGTESNLGVLGNVMPAVKTALSGASRLVSELLPKIVQEIPSIINENLPILAEAAISIVQSLVDGISENQEMLITTAMETITYLASSILTMLPQIVQLGLDLIVSLANGITESLPELIPTIIDVVLQIVETITKPETLNNLLDAALAIINQLAWGLADAIPKLVGAVFVIVDNIVDFLLDPANLVKLISAAVEIVIALCVGIVKAIPQILIAATSLIVSIVDIFAQADWEKLGDDLVSGFKKGIQNAWRNLKKWFKNLFGDLIGIAKKILGIASPSKVFKKLGSFTADGFGIGFEDEFANVKNDMEDALNFDDASVGINASIRKVGAGSVGMAYGGNSFGDVYINIDGASYDDPHGLAVAVAEELQNMTDRRLAVYA